MKRILLFMATATAAIAVVPFQAGAVGPPPRFELSPASLSFSAPAGGFDYHSVTVTNNRGPLVIQNPASGDSHFFDTQAGTCWQTYEVFGDPIPAHTSCSIEVGFTSATAGTFTGTLTVYRCLTWIYVGPTNSIICTSTDGGETVDLTGTAT
jgi:hypothetical protein